MIISVSRRTDIPAFYSEWFFNRLKEGFVYVVNPMNLKQVSKIELTPETVDCFVFWTKNAKPMLNRLDELKDYNYYFQYTITGYQSDVEKGVLNKKEVINTFKELSKKIGKEKVILRYDPIFFSAKYSIEYHCEAFERLCAQLDGYTERCVISFIDLYKKTERNTKILDIIPMTMECIKEISKRFALIASKHNMSIETCSEAYDLSQYGIKKGKCIDDDIISDIIGYELNVKKDDTQRDVCGCVKSIDIGQYNTCKHHCLYCYANFNYNQVQSNSKMHDKNYPLLSGKVREDAKITIRNMKSIRGKKLGEKQITLFE
ncbi:DUF1848 domain-containing protein [Clostridium perfringens]|uniref:DUF1848 domain-containing protein n=1 Tax=Clostridium perfringens TaxID=1502 RepID=UPI000BBA4B27|nr:DUF1848 domain-containing protein [Clostridium perfringens]MDM0474177.1 DUF1848 domain-containing protein [Clostridium perfringens]MDM0477529.1 DUF1848 domain-containing protein [Clostridium perfringens]MDM0479169.1 DUF1848 domain-containing protein [Clostridium perfringens]MDM0482044.1 DUF1848 domain-containing protein [Clostridium perfringens]MDM0485891.1 DUF1848 domain-containing protein [Clostridium perfringens]